MSLKEGRYSGLIYDNDIFYAWDNFYDEDKNKYYSYFIKCLDGKKETYSNKIFSNRYNLFNFYNKKSSIIIEGNNIKPINFEEPKIQNNKIDKKTLDLELKKYKNISENNNTFTKGCTLNELKIYNFLGESPLIPKIIGRNGLNVVFEREKCNIESYILSKNYRNEDIVNWFFQMVDSIKFLHDNNIIHKDIKCQNFLMTEKGIIKICDLECDGSTASYRAPEVRSLNTCDKKSDIFSLGMTLYELITTKQPYMFVKPTISKYVQKCIEIDKNKRPNIEDIINWNKEDFFKDINTQEKRKIKTTNINFPNFNKFKIIE